MDLSILTQRGVNGRGDARGASNACPSAGALENVSREHGFERLRVEGALPSDLRGGAYWNGTGIFEQFGERHSHWFDGQGVVTAIRFGEGGVEGAVRLIETPSFAEERREGRTLFGYYGSRSPRPLREFLLGNMKHPANTSILAYRDRLFALAEIGHPYELSSHDLATLGKVDFDGVVAKSFYTHMHYVPARRARYSFGEARGRTDAFDVFELPDFGAPRVIGQAPVSSTVIVHDFIVTEHHVVFFVPPLRVDVLSLLLRGKPYCECLAWRPEEGVEVVVMSVADPRDVVRFRVDPFFAFHHANAFERRGEIVVDFVGYADFSVNRWLGDFSRGVVSTPFGSTLRRAVIDPARKKLSLSTRWDGSCEFPVVARGAENSADALVALVSHSTPLAARSGMTDCVALVDGAGRAMQVSVGAGCYAASPLFAGPPEDPGKYVLAPVYDANRHASHVAVIDARRPAAGPIARVHLEEHVPYPFHGAFQPT